MEQNVLWKLEICLHLIHFLFTYFVVVVIVVMNHNDQDDRVKQ